jgi:hypothetical protein
LRRKPDRDKVRWTPRGRPNWIARYPPSDNRVGTLIASRAVMSPRIDAAQTSRIYWFGMTEDSSTTPPPRLPFEPDPVIEAYKKDVDRTLIRENLKLTVQQRMDQLVAQRKFARDLRLAMLKARH